MTLAIARPRLNPSLSVLAAILIASYVALMVATIIFAAIQTKLARGVQDTQVAISALESDYYDAIANLNQTDPASLGYVKPSKTRYVEAKAANVAFAR